MEYKKWIEKQGYFFCLTVLLSSALILLIEQQMGLSVNAMVVLILIILWSGLIQLLDSSTKNRSLILTIGVTVIVLMIIIGILQRNRIVAYMKWIVQGQDNNHPQVIWYSFVTITICVLFIVVVCHFVQKFKKIRYAMAIVSGIGLVSMAIMEYQYTKFGMVALAMYELFVLTEYRLERGQKNDGPHTIKKLVYLAPVLLVVFGILLLLPTSKEPMKWSLVRSVIGNIGDMNTKLYAQIQSWFNQESAEFGIQFSGYSEGGKVGGDVKNSLKLALELAPNESLDQGIYITGNTKGKYTGHEWKNEDTNDIGDYKEYELDLWELYTFMSHCKQSKFAKHTLQITYSDIYTSTLFYPLKLCELELANQSIRYKVNGSNLRFLKLEGEGTYYKVRYYPIDYGDNDIQTTIRAITDGTYTKTADIDYIRSYVENNLQEDATCIPEQLEQLLEDRAKQIKIDYMQLPEELPERVSELAKSLTKGLTNPYDQLKAIEQFLNGYTYTETPGNPPKDQDIVDYFLFDSKQGYCTYFASAMTVMARCIGIPARYVQGFSVSLDHKMTGGTISVSNGDAHAWTEAYLEGVGWIPLEPTASYYDVRYVRKEEEPVLESGNKTEHNPSSYMEELEQKKKQESEQNRITKEKQHAVYGVVFYVVTGVIVVIILFTIGTFIITSNRRRKKCAHQSGEQQYLDSMRRILYYERYLNNELAEGETLLQFASHSFHGDESRQKEFHDIVNVYMRVRYQDACVTEQEAEEMKAYQIFLEKELRATCGKVRSFIAEYRYWWS